MSRWVQCVEIVFVVMAIMPPVSASDLNALSTPAASESPVSASTPATAGPASALAASPASAAAAGSDSGETLFLDVKVNGRFIGKIGEFTLLHGKLMARPDELRALGFRVPVSRVAASGGLISLSDLAGVTCVLDEKDQVIEITASDSARVPTLLQPSGRELPGGRRIVESGTGVTLNYDTVGTFVGGQKSGTGSFDLRAFSPGGVLSSQWLAYAGAGSGPGGSNTAIRLDSTYTFSDVNTLVRYSLGDFITGGLSWTRPVHLEGAQIMSDFSMRPDLVTFPMPSVAGSAAVPSTVNVLTDGSLTVSGQVSPGPFEIPQLPVVEGAGTISMTVTNALGQQVTLTQPFYASSAMLAPGLHTFAVESGWARRNWGSVSNDYGPFAGAGLFRTGVTPKFTFEASGEATSGAIMAGAGGVVQIASLGIVNFAVAPSFASGRGGAQFSAGTQRIGRIFSVGASAIIADRTYRDVAALNGAGVPRKQLSAFAGLSFRRLGSGGLAYAETDQNPLPIGPQPITPLPTHSQVVSANYSVPFHHMFFYLAEFHDLVNQGNSQVQIGLTIPFGKRNSITVSAASDGSGQVEVQQPAPMIGDRGYQAFLSTGNSTHVFAQAQYKSPVGLFTAGVDESGGTVTMRMESQGALSLVDHALFPSNEIYDSFAIVDTSPISHVHVLQENRNVGSTNASGRLLVPDMRSFDLNRIAIQPADIPPEASLTNATRDFRPQDRSGVVVKFPIRFSHGALLRLVDQVGAAVPLGSTATLRATGTVVPIGYDGDAYVEDLSPHNELAIEFPDGRRCTVAFDYKPLAGEIPLIGPLRCLDKKP